MPYNIENLKQLSSWLPPLDQAQYQKLIDYAEILIQQAMPAGFIGDCDPQVLLERHLLDSLLPITSPIKSLFKSGAHIGDLGSGAGLPGIPLAIACPHVSFAAVEASVKKGKFLEQTVEQLQLSNFTVIAKEIELIAPMSLDAVIYRAFRKPLASLELALHVLKIGGHALYYRAKQLDFSIGGVPERLSSLGYKVVSFQEFTSPQSLGPRGMYLFERYKRPDQGFPRPWRKIQKDRLCETFA